MVGSWAIGWNRIECKEYIYNNWERVQIWVTDLTQLQDPNETLFLGSLTLMKLLLSSNATLQQIMEFILYGVYEELLFGELKDSVETKDCPGERFFVKVKIVLSILSVAGSFSSLIMKPSSLGRVHSLFFFILFVLRFGVLFLLSLRSFSPIMLGLFFYLLSIFSV